MPGTSSKIYSLVPRTYGHLRRWTWPAILDPCNPARGRSDTCLTDVKAPEAGSPDSNLTTAPTRSTSPASSATSIEQGLELTPTEIGACVAIPEPLTGTDWCMMQTALQMLHSRSQLPPKKAGAYTEQEIRNIRSLHVDAVRYMLGSLPRDLTQLEIASLRTCVPVQVLHEDPSPKPPTGVNRYLRAVVAQLIFCVLSLISLSIPYLSTAVGWLSAVLFGIPASLVSFEREHQVTNRVTVRFLDLLVGKDADVQGAIARFDGTPLCGALAQTTYWLAEVVGGGVADGCKAARHTPAVQLTRA